MFCCGECLCRCGCLAAWEALLVIDAFVALLSSAELVGRETVDTLAQHLDDVRDRWGKSVLSFPELHLAVPGHTSLKWAGSYLMASWPPLSPLLADVQFTMLIHPLLNRNSLTSVGTLPPLAAPALPVTTCSSGRRPSWAP